MTGLRIIYNALIKRDDWSKFFLAEKISRMIYQRYKFSEFGRVFLHDDDFIRYYESFEGTENYHSLDRKYALDQLMKLAVSLEGDTAECGAYKGASSFLICRRIAGQQKKHHVFDSFEGLSVPRPEDGSYWGKGNLATSEALIRENLKEFDFVVYHKGWIPEKFQEVSVMEFCFVHLDVDLFQPTLASLRFFYERLSPGGIIVCDDYGFITCPGARKAMDLFFSKKPEEVISLPTGQGFVMRKQQ
ncbi:MAG: hypothetical protein BA861_00210 [Desulfobacterales bacterium S3730MH5]|nr:MAG: hypothetical protein BA861_00210 [Desulfobacterales bacterium S3730MH5]